MYVYKYIYIYLIVLFLHVCRIYLSILSTFCHFNFTCCECYVFSTLQYVIGNCRFKMLLNVY